MIALNDFLRRVPFFADLAGPDLAHMASILTKRTFPADNLIILAEDAGDSLFLICSGQVKVSIINEDGREVILATLGPGDFFGEMSLLDGKPRSANVIATEETELLTLYRTDFLRLIEQLPELAIKVIAALTARLRKADRKIESLALMDVTGRVAAVLLQLAEESGAPTPRGAAIHSRPTQQELANMAGTSRETVSRVFKRLEQQGYIATRGREIVILRETDLRNDYTL